MLWAPSRIGTADSTTCPQRVPENFQELGRRPGLSSRRAGPQHAVGMGQGYTHPAVSEGPGGGVLPMQACARGVESGCCRQAGWLELCVTLTET